MTNDIYRILAPSEYKALLAAIPKIDKRILVETMLNTGMRYEELRAFGDNPQWFSAKNRCITLPASSTKTKRGRTVHLTPQFSEKLELYLASNELKYPLRQAMAKDLRRWWYEGLGYNTWVGKDSNSAVKWSPIPKTFRKTWETYLIRARLYHLKQNSAYYEIEDVMKSQGHKNVISLEHYYNTSAVLKEEKELQAVLELTRGWMM